MGLFFRREMIILVFDLFISLFAFWFARYFGDLPRWYWLVLSAVIWVILGGLSRKLQFDSYKRIRYALLGILMMFSPVHFSTTFTVILFRGTNTITPFCWQPELSFYWSGHFIIPSGSWSIAKFPSFTKRLCPMMLPRWELILKVPLRM